MEALHIAVFIVTYLPAFLIGWFFDDIFSHKGDR